jgi:hypothetical protein
MDVILFIIGLFLMAESLAVLNLMRRDEQWVCRIKYLLSAMLGLWTMFHSLNHDLDLYDFTLVAALSLFVFAYGENRYRMRDRLENVFGKLWP